MGPLSYISPSSLCFQSFLSPSGTFEIVQIDRCLEEMENERYKRSDQNKRKIKHNENSTKRKECETEQSASSAVAEQQINNNIDQNNDSKIVQRASDATELSLSTIFGNQRFSAVSSQHIPTTSLLPSTASIGTSSLIPNAPNIVKQTSNKTPQNSVGTARNILNNQEQKDISGDDVAADELDEQIPVAVPSYQNKSNNFQTPVNSPRIYLKYCGNLLMAPKKQPTRARRCMKKAAESTTEKE
uniref:Uncharacterized protein n=1 Tax=Onchocerca volvulus TaxID=6282 RepID=A0A8R1U1X2_ONCVO